MTDITLELIPIRLVTGEDDDRSIKVSRAHLDEIVRTRRFDYNHSDFPEDEDFWGEYYVEKIVGNVTPGPVTVHLRRT